jgi:hypothetical protein
MERSRPFGLMKHAGKMVDKDVPLKGDLAHAVMASPARHIRQRKRLGVCARSSAKNASASRAVSRATRPFRSIRRAIVSSSDAASSSAARARSGHFPKRFRPPGFYPPTFPFEQKPRLMVVHGPGVRLTNPRNSSARSAGSAAAR